MALIRWEPFREMNRLFESLTLSEDGGFDCVAFRSAEIYETPNSIELKLEVPGMEAKDLDAQVTEDAVSISGEHHTETRIQECGITRSDFRYGKFQRVIPLPATIPNNQMKAA